jgi:acyl carrier protein
MQASLEERVLTLIAHHLGRRRDQIELTQSLRRDLGFDNLSLVGIALELEDHHGSEFPFERLEDVDSISDLVLLTSSLAARTPSTRPRPGYGRRLGTLGRVVS